MSLSVPRAPISPRDVAFQRYVNSKPLPPLPDETPKPQASNAPSSTVSYPPPSTAPGASRTRVRLQPRPQSEVASGSPPSYDEVETSRRSLESTRPRPQPQARPIRRPPLLPTYSQTMRQSSESPRDSYESHRSHSSRNSCQCGIASCPGGDIARRSNRRR